MKTLLLFFSLISSSALAADACLIESYNQATGKLISNMYCNGAYVKGSEGRAGLTALLQELLNQGFKIDGLAAGELDGKVMWHTLSR